LGISFFIEGSLQRTEDEGRKQSEWQAGNPAFGKVAVLLAKESGTLQG